MVQSIFQKKYWYTYFEIAAIGLVHISDVNTLKSRRLHWK